MTDISKHPLLKACYEACLAIEKLGASPEQTDAVSRVSDMMRPIEALVDQLATVTQERDALKQEIERLKEELGPLRFDWEGAHDRLDKAGVMTAADGGMGVHLHKRLDAALADRHALAVEARALRAALTGLLGIGESDEWECAHGARVSRRCGVPGCGLGPVRKVLAIASSEDLGRDIEASIRRDALAQLGGPETVDRLLALAGPDLLKRLDAAEAPCVWTYNRYQVGWDRPCEGQLPGSYEPRLRKFCPGCGHPVQVKQPQDAATREK